MAGRRKDRLVGSLLSLPTLNDEDYNLLLDRQRIHLNWVIENGITEGNGVFLMAGGLGEGPFFPNQESVSEALRRSILNSLEASGFMVRVDWDQSIFDGLYMVLCTGAGAIFAKTTSASELGGP